MNPLVNPPTLHPRAAAATAEPLDRVTYSLNYVCRQIEAEIPWDPRTPYTSGYTQKGVDMPLRNVNIQSINFPSQAPV